MQRAAVLVVLLLVCIGTSLAADSTSSSSSSRVYPSGGGRDSTQNAAADSSTSTSPSLIGGSDVGALLSRIAEQFMQRVQRTPQQPSRPTGNSNNSAAGEDDSDSTVLAQDFTSTANALTAQAVREGNAQAAALAEQVEYQASVANSSSSTNSSASGDVAALQLQELQQQALTGQNATTSNGNNSSSSGDASLSGLQLLLRTINDSWDGIRRRQQQRQQQQQQPGGGNTAALSASEQWTAGLDALGARYPSLSGFASLARNSAFTREVSGSQLLPAVILAPTNAVLGDYLSALQALEAQTAVDAAGSNEGGGHTGRDNSSSNSSSTNSSNSSGGGGGDNGQEVVSLQQLVDEFVRNKAAASLTLVRRHLLPARQPHLLDVRGNINSQLLERAGNPLVFSSLVLRTTLGTYIQVSELPRGPAAHRLAQAVNPRRAAAAASTSTAPPAAEPATASAAPSSSTSNSSTPNNNQTQTQTQSGPANSSTTTSGSGSAPQLLHVGHAGSALVRPFLLSPTNVLVVPIDTVLTELDEVVNSRTAARLRGAFGWSPEDEQALLSTVYLDPASSFWGVGGGSSAGGVVMVGRGGEGGGSRGAAGAGGGGGQQQQGLMMMMAAMPVDRMDGPQPGSNSTNAAGSNSSGQTSSSNSSSAQGARGRLRRLQQQQEQQQQQQQQPDTSSPQGNPPSAAGQDSSVGGGVGGGGGDSRDAPAQGQPTLAPGAGSSSSSSSNNPPAASSQQGGDPPPDTPIGPASGTVPAFVAETRARQQQMLVQMQMADALAANLMTTEAISAWVSAAVLNPAAVFDATSLQRLPRVPTAVDDNNNTNNSSGRGDSCWTDNWGGAGSANGSNRQLVGADSAPGTTCPLVDWSSTCVNLPCTAACAATSNRNSSGGSMCLMQSAVLVGSTAENSSSNNSGAPTRVSGVYQPSTRGFCSRISSAWVAGLSPYQLYPSLGLAENSNPATNSSANTTTTSNSNSNSNSASGGGGGGAGGGGGNRRRARRALRQTAATTNSDATSTSTTGSGTPSSSSQTGARAAAPKPDELAFLPALQLAKLLADGTITPQLLLAACRDRMQRYDSLLNTVVTHTAALADRQAAAAQQALLLPSSPAASAPTTTNSPTNSTSATSTTASTNTSRSSGDNGSGSVIVSGCKSLLCGIPYGLKDMFSVPAYPTSWGLTALKTRTIDTPSWAFSALSGPAAAVLLAKTATGELAWGDTWFDNITTRNPWNIDTGSCGSSAGSAAAVAAGLLPFAIGSETWGSVVCPATTVGVTAYRPSGGTIPTNGLLQVSVTLDKTGIFCRSVLDCAVVADALMDTQAAAPAAVAPASSTPNSSNPSSRDGGGGGGGGGVRCTPPSAPTAAPRLYRQDPARAAAFNYSLFTAQQPPSPPLPPQQTTNIDTTNSTTTSSTSTAVLPPSFQHLPRMQDLCIGFLQGTSTSLLSVLRSMQQQSGPSGAAAAGGPGVCIKGPLPPPGDPHMVRDVLPTILQAEVAVSYEGLWLEGLITQDNHWFPSLMLGQLAPAATYLRAQQLRGLLLQQTRQYFEAHGVQVLLKPARSSVGLDGLAALLDMPELVLPVELGSATSEDADPVQVSASSSGGGGGAAAQQQAWMQPKVNSLLALPGADAAVIAVGAAFQSVTDVHLQQPPLPTPHSSGSSTGDGGRVVRG